MLAICLEDGLLPAPFMALARRCRAILRRLRGTSQQINRVLFSNADSRLIATAFDQGYYLATNPDVAAAGVDPISHFLRSGWKEGRDPTSDFSVRDYCELNPGVVEAGQNPYAHYLRSGRRQGRVAKQNLGFQHDILVDLETLDARLARAAARWKSTPRTSRAKLGKALARSRAAFSDFHLTVSHDNYAVNIGGLQLCVQREAQALSAAGVDHMHIFPVDIYPTLRVAPDSGLLGVLWNGELVGHFQVDDLADGLGEALRTAGNGQRSFALHSMLGHCRHDILNVLRAAGLQRGYFWLHDYASVCAGFHLLRNDVADCGAPPPQSAGCGVCLYGARRSLHMLEHRALFEALSLTVVAPSPGALNTWLGATDLPHVATLVLPHATLGATRSPQASAADDRLRVAFIGVPTAHKGWPIFHDLVERFVADSRYEFMQLGRKAADHLPITFHDVTVSADRPHAMAARLVELEVDVALIWPLCRETFSFTAFEAVSAGVAVLTNPDSGNVADFIANSPFGRVLPDDAALYALFETGDVLSLSRAQRKPHLYNLEFSTLSAQLR